MASAVSPSLLADSVGRLLVEAFEQRAGHGLFGSDAGCFCRLDLATLFVDRALLGFFDFAGLGFNERATARFHFTSRQIVQHGAARTFRLTLRLRGLLALRLLGALWRALGHGRPAAELLTRLTTTRTPAPVRERLWEDNAPTSAQTIVQRRSTHARLAQLHLQAACVQHRAEIQRAAQDGIGRPRRLDQPLDLATAIGLAQHRCRAEPLEGAGAPHRARGLRARAQRQPQRQGWQGEANGARARPAAAACRPAIRP